ncbi:MAG: hypothetical protein PWQ61_214 [Betaproteobacteria bacterium]|nr:hypothetical protein [Betaproteobacteria bacterium]
MMRKFNCADALPPPGAILDSAIAALPHRARAKVTAAAREAANMRMD